MRLKGVSWSGPRLYSPGMAPVSNWSKNIIQEKKIVSTMSYCHGSYTTVIIMQYQSVNNSLWIPWNLCTYILMIQTWSKWFKMIQCWKWHTHNQTWPSLKYSTKLSDWGGGGVTPLLAFKNIPQGLWYPEVRHPEPIPIWIWRSLLPDQL